MADGWPRGDHVGWREESRRKRYLFIRVDVVLSEILNLCFREGRSDFPDHIGLQFF